MVVWCTSITLGLKYERMIFLLWGSLDGATPRGMTAGGCVRVMDDSRKAGFVLRDDGLQRQACFFALLFFIFLYGSVVGRDVDRAVESSPI